MISHKITMILIFIFIFLSLNAMQQAETPVYVGPKKCKLCHDKDYIGNQYDIWIKGPHSKAYQTLLNEQSKEIARKMGINAPEKSKKCLQCHVTAFSEIENKKADLSFEDGVSCEACHGPGSQYRTLTKMRKIASGELEKAEYGMIDADEKLCKTCHNKNSPTYKDFDFTKAVKKISHPVPPQEKQK